MSDDPPAASAPRRVSLGERFVYDVRTEDGQVWVLLQGAPLSRYASPADALAAARALAADAWSGGHRALVREILADGRIVPQISFG